MANDLAALAARLKINGAINLRSTVTSPCPLNPNAIHGRGRTYTGLGKWTHIAATGVEYHGYPDFQVDPCFLGGRTPR